MALPPIACHGPEKSKGKVTLHTIDGDLSTGREMERLEPILIVFMSGEMPAEDEKQSNEVERKEMVK